MICSSQNFSRNVDWNLLKTFHEITEAGGVSRALQQMDFEVKGENSATPQRPTPK